MNNSPGVKVWLALLFLYVAWGSTYLCIHWLVEVCPPILASGARNFLAGFLLLVLFYKNSSADFSKITAQNVFQLALSGILMLTAGNALLTIAIHWVPSGYASLFPAIVPVWLVIIEWFLGKKPNLLTSIGLLLGIIGMFFLINQKNLAINGYETYFAKGVLFLILSTLGWSAGVMLMVRKPTGLSLSTVSGFQMIFGGGLSLIISLSMGENWHEAYLALNAKAVLAFIYLLIIGSIIGFNVFGWLSKKAPPAWVSTYSYVNPLVAILLGAIFLKEKITPNIMLSAFFIVLAVVSISIGGKQTKLK
jgi:drug/metabolite transporter (DMT)-like permease